MTKIKYILSAILLIIGIFITGEMQFLIAGSRLSECAYVDYELDKSYSSDENPEEVQAFIDLFKSISQEYDVGIYIQTYTYPTELSTITDVYCTKNSEEFVKDGLSGHYSYSSVLAGKNEYRINDIDELEKIEKYQAVNMIGNQNDVSKAREKLSGYIKEIYFEDSDSFRYDLVVYGVLALIFVAIMLFYISDVNTKRKEYVIKYIHGESPFALIGKYFALDAAVTLSIIASEVFLVSRFDNVLYAINELVIFTIILLSGELLCYLPLLKANPVVIFKGKENKKKILSANYAVKVLISAIIVCVLTLFVNFYNKSKPYIMSAEFFEEHDDYSYCRVQTEGVFGDIEAARESAKIPYKIARDYYEETMPILILYQYFSVYDYQEDYSEGGYVFSNYNGMEYLSSVIPELGDVEIKSDYIVVADKAHWSKREKEKCLNEINQRYDAGIDGEVLYDENNVQFLILDDGYELMAHKGESTDMTPHYYKNVPIIIDAVPENKSKYSIEEMNSGSESNYMFRIDEKLKTEIIEEYDLVKFTQTNCKENFDHFWRMNKIGLIYFGVFSVLLIILEIAVLSFVVKLEFSLNQEERCIQKVLGYSFMSRYIELIATTIIMSVICFAISIFVMTRIEISVVIPLTFSILLLVMEFFIIVFNSIKLEKENIQKVLKGGAL